MESNVDRVNLAIRQFCDAWRVMTKGSPRPTIDVGDGIEFVFSGLPISFFNAAVITARDISAERLAAFGRQAREWASDKGVPYLLIVTHDALASGVDATAALAGSSLAPFMPATGMLAHGIAPATREPEGLELVVPDAHEGYAAVLDINSRAYGADLEAGKPSMGRGAFWDGHVPVLGLVDGTPVSCAAVLMVEGYRYVALVATDPSCQRRGYAEATMRRALEVAAEKHGDRPSVLHATDAGRPIYARMGYETISRHTFFIERRFVEGH